MIPIEQNELIARFMGLRVEKGVVYLDDAFGGNFDSVVLKYHESWDGIYHARVGLVCVCGEPLFFNLAEDMDHVKKTCGCGLTWRTEEDGEIEIIAKIVIKK